MNATAYPQFGNPDYSGFTTEEELARRFITTDARGSLAVGAQVRLDGSESPSAPPPLPPCAMPPQMRAAARAPMPLGGPALTTQQAIATLFKSRPTTLLDWIIIFIIIIALVCLAERANDMMAIQHSSRCGGNFCSTCGGTV